MTPHAQLQTLHGEMEAQAIYAELKATNNFAGFCRQFMHDEDHRVARNALWVLTKANKAEITLLQPLLHDLQALAMTTGNPAVRRLSLNIVERLTIREEDLQADFLDFCFKHMAAPDEYPGIQSLCMKLAFRMCSFHPELAGEFRRTIENLDMDYYSTALKSVRNKIINGKMK